ncbi:hypothetical protein L537_3457 [Bordetella hinzii 1277]|uniref:hypothetical protein n=1 Tax=Bordetella hinzii TaxID=103855 RepID=UPI000459B7C9|nr:hypothetical protein [Bordetella hinzii]KCB52685.1 hypothetical protein L537_3457 [Bordetella hinzii 1277]
MKFFSIKDRVDDLKWSLTTGDKILNGAKLLGAVVANTAIGVGKAAAEAAPHIKERLEEEKKKR